MQPTTSVLLEKTSRLAPDNRYFCLQGINQSAWFRFKENGRHGPNLFEKEAVELILAVLDAETVGCVDNPDEGIGFLKVVAPVRAECFLAAHIPFFPQSNVLALVPFTIKEGCRESYRCSACTC
jgi:hypothetical protein